MKTKSEIIRIIALLLTAVICGFTFASCGLGGGGRTVHTIIAGTGTLSPDTEDTTESAAVPEDTTVPEDTSVETDVQSSDSVPTESSEAITTTGDETLPPAADYEYEVITSSSDLGSNGGVKSTKTLRYPKIGGTGSETIENKINTLLANIAEAKFSVRVTNVAELLADGTGIQYEVTKSEVKYLGNNILSVRSEGRVAYSGNGAGKDEKFIYCNFVNLSTGKELKSKDIYSDFGAILDMLGSGTFTKISGEDGGLDEFIREYRANMVYNVFPEAYFTADSLVIALDGASAEYAIPLDKVNACLAVSPTK